MDVIEIRDLDGPNLFALHPVIKIEVSLEGGATAPDGERSPSRDAGALEQLAANIRDLHARAGQPVPEVGSRALDTPGSHAVFFPWEWRESALAIARIAVASVDRSIPDDAESEIRSALDRDRASGDRPLWVRDDQRHIPIVGVTGTNGKTTTTRLLAHLLRTSGKRVGWSSSSGVFIEGDMALEGDYTGPAGARRVLDDPRVEVAVLETARGGILLRGVAYESNDVGVFLNVTPDHLDLQGVRTIETLAEVKSVVVRVTKPDGLVVLNADDPLALGQRSKARAAVLLTSQRPGDAAIGEHEGAGGKTVTSDGEAILYFDGSRRQQVTALEDAPLTYGGAAPHMVENALAATGAAIGLGVDLAAIAAGLRTFRPDLRSNAGRLNVFLLDGRTIVIDYAHNESGLKALLAFVRRIMQPGGRLAAIIGTAGDRQDSVLHGLGQIAAAQADLVFIKDNPRYLRGRPPGQQVDLMRAGIGASGAAAKLCGVYPGEFAALAAAIDATGDGDAIAVMCVEEQLAIFRDLRERGAAEWQ